MAERQTQVYSITACENPETKKKPIRSQKIILFIMIALAGAIVGGIVVGLVISKDRLSSPGSSDTRRRRSLPNFIIMYADDTGYADFQAFGNPVQEWTGVDRMAKEGMKFTSWYTSAAICTPSRAALLTGRYPVRNGMFGSNALPAFSSTSSGGLPKREETIAEALKVAGYATGMVGKWHLGLNEYNSTDGSHLPIHHGFDYVGTILPTTQLWVCDPKKYTVAEMSPSCFVYDNNVVVEQPINLQTLTSRLVRDTKNFITENRNEPFLFYLPFPQTHAALFASPEFTGSSRIGPYGDTVNEMGWAVNQVLDHLVDLGLDEDTLVIFLSDHGPVRDGCGEEGSKGAFRGGKLSTWEGGVRVPAVAWWPGTITPDTVSHTVVNSIDLFPTILELAGIGNFPSERNILIDGKDITGILKSNTKDSPHEALFFYCSDLLTAVRYKRYKIHYYSVDIFAPDLVSAERPMCDNILDALSGLTYQNSAVKLEPPLIFDVVADPAEHIFMNPNTTEYRTLLQIVDSLVESHKSTVVSTESEIDKPLLEELTPCCNPPACVCNYNEEAQTIVETFIV